MAQMARVRHPTRAVQKKYKKAKWNSAGKLDKDKAEK